MFYPCPWPTATVVGRSALGIHVLGGDGQREMVSPLLINLIENNLGADESQSDKDQSV